MAKLGSTKKPKSVEDVRLRTIKEAAQFLKVGQTTIYRLGRAGVLDLIKVGRSLRVTRFSLNRFIENAKQNSK